MRWRRGLLLAGIQLAAAVPLIVTPEAEEEAYIHEHYTSASQELEQQPSSDGPAEETEEVGFDPCAMAADYSAQEQLPRLANLPGAILSGWQQLCPPHWTLAGRLGVGYSWPRPSTIPLSREVAVGFLFLIATQWFLVGGFPLVQPKQWWREPGAFITCCTVLGSALAFIRPFESFARLPALLAAIAWFWWFGLLVWKTALFARRVTARKPAAAC